MLYGTARALPGPGPFPVGRVGVGGPGRALARVPRERAKGLGRRRGEPVEFCRVLSWQ